MQLLVSRCFVINIKSCFTTFAGAPAAKQFGGISFVATAPAATTEFSPIVTLGIMLAAAPIHAFFFA